ncbi:MAG: AEC family transporter [Ignavibacteria bacterium]|jgi:predicted permease
MFDVFLQLSVPLVCGVLYKFIPSALPAADVRKIISSIVLNVFIPLLTFGVLSQVHIGEHLWTIPIVSISSVLVGLLLGYIVYGVLLRNKMSPAAIGSLILASTWCNAMYLGLPITTAVLGDGARHIPIEYDYLGMTPLLFSIGTIICVRYGTGNSSTSWSEGLRQVATLPPMITILVALVINVVNVPIAPWLSAACLKAGSVVPQLMLFSIGLSLSLPALRAIPQILPAVAIRTIAVPTIMWASTLWLIQDPTTERGAILETAMPTMMLTMVFAEKYGLDTGILAQAILGSTIVSIFTLSMIASML